MHDVLFTKKNVPRGGFPPCVADPSLIGKATEISMGGM
jgi:hypothetical protein